jgi:hypothetical protein
MVTTDTLLLTCLFHIWKDIANCTTKVCDIWIHFYVCLRRLYLVSGSLPYIALNFYYIAITACRCMYSTILVLPANDCAHIEE